MRIRALNRCNPCYAFQADGTDNVACNVSLIDADAVMNVYRWFWLLLSVALYRRAKGDFGFNSFYFRKE